MESKTETLCTICGEEATNWLTASIPLCNNVCCFYTKLDMIEETLEKAKGGDSESL